MLMLGLKKRYSGALIEKSEITAGMIRKIESFIAWGEPSDESVAALEKAGKLAEKKGYGPSFGLKPPVKGLIAIKLNWPKGDSGYRGEAINELLKRML
jgi:hypothetical protein